MTLATKVVVVTGSTRGIGKAIASACASQGARVFVSSRRGEAVDVTIAELAATGANVAGCTCDVADAGQVEALREAAFARYGAIDAWVSNAGISQGYRPLDELGYDELAEIVKINLLGHMTVPRQASGACS